MLSEERSRIELIDRFKEYVKRYKSSGQLNFEITEKSLEAIFGGRVINFTGMKLSGMNFSDLSLSCVVLSNCDLRYTSFKNCELESCSFIASNLRFAKLTNAFFDSCVVSYADFSYANLRGATFERTLTNLVLSDGADMEGVSFIKCGRFGEREIEKVFLSTGVLSVGVDGRVSNSIC